jgi:hypothetical protein
MRGGDMSDPEIINEQIEVYRRSFLEHGDSPAATFATGREVQDLRFERIMRPLLAARTPFSIHDVGAGLCDLHRYLLDRGIKHDYSATEIVPEMVELARKKYQGISVYDRDILSDEIGEQYDFVVLSGVFNIPGRAERAAWNRFALELIARMYDLATVATSFNFLTAHRTRTDPALFYLDPGEILSFCVKNLSRFVAIDHGYPLFECTVTVFNPDFVRSSHSDQVFDKYFAVTRIES